MKKAFILLCVFIAFFHFLLPYIYYELFSFKTSYQPSVNILYSRVVFFKVMILNFVSLITAACIIYRLPSVKVIEAKKINHSHFLYFTSIAFVGGLFYVSGGHSGMLAGKSAGNILNYLSIFISPGVIFSFLLVFVENINVSLIYIGFLVFSGITSTRAFGLLSLYNCFYLLSSSSLKARLTSLIKLASIGLVLSIVLYGVISNLRTKQNAFEGVKNSTVVDMVTPIVNRLSYLETGMIAVLSYDESFFVKEKFNKFYSLNDQFKQVLQFFVPRFIREWVEMKLKFNEFTNHKLQPNLYYRYIFQDVKQAKVESNYISINMSYSVYLWLKTSFYTAYFLTVLTIVSYYLLIYYISKYSLIVSFCLLINFSNLISFFDFVDFTVTLQRAILAIFSFVLVAKILDFIVVRFKIFFELDKNII